MFVQSIFVSERLHAIPIKPIDFKTDKPGMCIVTSMSILI